MTPLLRQSWPYLSAVLSGVALTLCFPPFEQDWLAWLALVPLLATAWFGQLSPGNRLLAGYLGGLFFFGPTLQWLGTVTPAGWAALTLYLAIYPAIWTWFAGLPACRPVLGKIERSDSKLAPWRRSAISVAVAATLSAAWAMLEWLRGWLFTGLGWNGLGTTLHANLPFLQLTRFGGVPLLSFLIVFANVITVTTIARLIAEAGRLTWASRSDFTVALALIVSAFGLGVRLSFEPVEERPIKVSLVQGNVRDEGKALTEYLQLTSLALIQSPDLIVWPEDALKRPLLDFLEELKSEAAALGIDNELETWLIAGSEEHSPDGSYNSAFAVAPGFSGLQTYRKRHLLPFYEAGWPGLFSSFPNASGYAAGTSAKPFWLIGADARPGALICVEDTIPALARANARADANILLNLTDDGLFRSRIAERQHFLNALFRAPETGLPLLRCANTGVTAIIDRQGRITQQLDAGQPGLLTGVVAFQTRPSQTWFTRHGQWVPVIFAGAILLRLIVSRKGKRDL